MKAIDKFENYTKEELLKEINKLTKKIISLEKEKEDLIIDKQRVKRLNRIYTILSKINELIIRTKNKKDLLKNACKIAVEDGLFKMVWVGFIDKKTKLVKPYTYWGYNKGYLESIIISAKDIPEGQGPTGTCIREGKPCIFNNLLSNPKMKIWINKALKRGYRSTGAFPIKINGQTIGAFTFHASEPDFFNEEEIKLLETLSEDISFALTHIESEKQKEQYEKKLKKSREQLRRLSIHLQNISEIERANIAHELHDEFGQILIAIKMNLFLLKNGAQNLDTEYIKKIETTIELIEKIINRVRTISMELRPVVLDKLGLGAAIEWQISEFKKLSNIEYEFINKLPTNLKLNPQISITIFRIFQEALTNAYKHSKANKIKVILEIKKGKIWLLVKDNGVGIKKNQINDCKTFGLIGMKERVYSLNGKINIRSSSNKGTEIKVLIPLNDKNDRNFSSR
ncbi:MAG: GAF domain-containing sensor histidine kinase [Caldisericia bacterium]|nr:GAF domain-containing sensor histidine kinase [Caldisericia bacterium]